MSDAAGDVKNADTSQPNQGNRFDRPILLRSNVGVIDEGEAIRELLATIYGDGELTVEHYQDLASRPESGLSLGHAPPALGPPWPTASCSVISSV